ncbi:MAG: alanine--glyoxylate aminotransferase family protein, partial [Candidatus Marinimicrobia bacterium]|nr:alanine--glyoxylate aminotransferase family protein [Candidatus Neomarinimicrobiota bacterium]
ARQWALDNGFELLAGEAYRSNTVTTVKNTRGISVGDLAKAVAEEGYLLSNGYGSLKEKTFRIAHMADRKPEVLQEYLDLLSAKLK